MAGLVSERMIQSLGVAALHSLAATAVVLVIGIAYGRKKLSSVDWLVLLWLVYDAIVHLTLVRTTARLESARYAVKI